MFVQLLAVEAVAQKALCVGRVPGQRLPPIWGRRVLPVEALFADGKFDFARELGLGSAPVAYSLAAPSVME
jgi:hypothetical protein